jgi:hypothetical protein
MRSRSSCTKIRPLPRHKDFHRYGFDDVSNLLGTPVLKETPTENAARASRLSDWAMLKSEVRGANSSECLPCWRAEEYRHRGSES